MFLQIHEPGETPLPHSQVRAVGIDLGTTNSAIAVCEQGKVEVLRNTHGHALVPSVVYYTPDQKHEVGYSALARSGRENGGAVIRSVKRLMEQGSLRLRIPGREITPVEVSADILRHLKHQAEAALGQEVKQAVITVPAYFDESARQATKDAARLAGLEPLRIISEPTAAALAYGLDEGAEGIYAIYDLGGGTFDISLLRLEKGVFQVLATGGDTQLGGDDFDRLLLEWALKRAGREDSPTDVWLLKARAAKEALSEAEEAFLVLENDKIKITRADFEELIAPLVEKTRQHAQGVMRDAKVDVSDIHGVVLVGGSTRVPMIRKAVENIFKRKPEDGVDPDLVVAAGAARQAEALTQGGDHLLLDVIPLSLGLETMGGLVEKLVHRNTPIPVSVSQEFTTWQDGQTGMQIHVLQGEREMVDQNRSLARFELAGIPPLPAGIARVKVTFTVDADGLLTVSAEEITTGAKQEVAVKPSYGLGLEQIEKMLEESMHHAKRDITDRLLAEAKVEAERMVIELESVIKQDAALLGAQELEKLRKAMENVKKSIAGTDRDAIDNAVQNLAIASQAFAERRMNSAIAKALKGHGINEWEKPEA